MAHLATLPLAGNPLLDAAKIQTILADTTPLQRERWKYTRQNKVLDLLTEVLPQQVVDAPKEHEESSTEHTIELPDLNRLLLETPAAAAALERCQNIEHVTLGQDEQHLTDDEAQFSATSYRVAAGCRATLSEIFTRSQNTCRLVWIELEPGAQLTHCRNFMQANKQWHYLHVTVGKDAQYQLHNHSVGAEILRQDILVDIIKSGAHAELVSSAVVGNGMHLDQQVRLQHMAPNATSKQTVHNIAGNKAQVSFGGRIHIHPNCDGTDAQLQNKNLALADSATINTKPELEIYSEDVSCAHGATVGQLDAAALFYCLSRGIAPAEARSLLSQAFIRTATTGPLGAAAIEQYNGIQL